jgi:hypothetical protein
LAAAEHLKRPQMPAPQSDGMPGRRSFAFDIELEVRAGALTAPTARIGIVISAFDPSRPWKFNLAEESCGLTSVSAAETYAREAVRALADDILSNPSKCLEVEHVVLRKSEIVPSSATALMRYSKYVPRFSLHIEKPPDDILVIYKSFAFASARRAVRALLVP